MKDNLYLAILSDFISSEFTIVSNVSEQDAIRKLRRSVLEYCQRYPIQINKDMRRRIRDEIYVTTIRTNKVYIDWQWEV